MAAAVCLYVSSAYRLVVRLPMFWIDVFSRFVAPTTLTPSGFSGYPRRKSHEGSHPARNFNSVNASPSDWLAAFPLDRNSVTASVDRRLQQLALTLGRTPLLRNDSYALAQQVAALFRVDIV